MTGIVWNVLAIDDKQKVLGDIEEVLTKGKHFGEDTFKVDKINSFEDGRRALADRRYDLIVLDVHKDSDPDPGAAAAAGEDNQAGERILAELKGIRFIPVIFYTGFPHKVRHLESPVVRVVEKGTKIEVLRDAVASILKTKLPHLTRHLEIQQRNFMWEALDKEWEKMGLEIGSDDLVYLMARRLANGLSRDAIQSFLGLSGDSINPVEMYIYPPLDPKPSTGDILSKDGAYWMIMTPVCDFAQEKADNVLLVRLIPLAETQPYKDWIEQVKQGAAADKEVTSTARGKVIGIIKDKKKERTKFLPGTFFLPDCFADFQQVKQLKLTDVDLKDRVCSMDSPYREEMLHLFSRYYGRIGTPDVDLDKHWAKIEKTVAPASKKP